MPEMQKEIVEIPQGKDHGRDEEVYKRIASLIRERNEDGLYLKGVTEEDYDLIGDEEEELFLKLESGELMRRDIDDYEKVYSGVKGVGKIHEHMPQIRKAFIHAVNNEMQEKYMREELRKMREEESDGTA
jgi:hypothetical protein